jgi:uncharacterized delta-60 repeat protein
VAVDTQGNIIAAGNTHTSNVAFSSDWMIAKFAPDGTLLWQRTVDGTGNNFSDDDFVRSVAVDTQGNVLVAGLTRTASTGSDFTVAKFDREGTLLWLQILSGTFSGAGNDSARSVAVDMDGNVLAAGDIVNTGNGADFTVAKFDRDGTLVWQQTLNGTANANDVASMVAVDLAGNVSAVGFTQNTGTGADFTVAKFHSDGTLLWQQTLNGTGKAPDGTANVLDRANAVAVDTQGNVLAAGVVTERDATIFLPENAGTGFDPTVAKFAPDGTLLWQQTFTGSASDDDTAESVAVDTPGNVLVTGVMTNTATGRDFMVAKFDGDGALLWFRTIDGTANDLEGLNGTLNSVDNGVGGRGRPGRERHRRGRDVEYRYRSRPHGDTVRSGRPVQGVDLLRVGRRRVRLHRHDRGALRGRRDVCLQDPHRWHRV